MKEFITLKIYWSKRFRIQRERGIGMSGYNLDENKGIFSLLESKILQNLLNREPQWM